MSGHKAGRRIWLWAAVLIIIFSVGGSVLVFHLAAREISVLMYHFVDTKRAAQKDPLVTSVETFENHLRLLKSWGYRIYSLDEYNNIKTGKMSSAAKGVVLTFDDGNRDFAEYIVPLLDKYRAPAANFLVWNNMRKHEMGSMSAKQARALAKNPLVTFGAHSMSHRELVGLNESELKEEIADSKRHLEKALKIPIRYFSYPGGYFDDGALAKVKEAGYLLAFTTSRKRLACRPPGLFTIPRLKISGQDANPVFFWFKVSGLQTMLDKVKFWMACRMKYISG